MFVRPCASLEQRRKQPTRCNKFRLLIFLNLLNQLYMFRATNSPILRSTFWLYIQLLVQCTDDKVEKEIKCQNENLSNGSRVVPWRQTDGKDRQTDRTVLIAAFHSYGNALQNGWHLTFFLKWTPQCDYVTPCDNVTPCNYVTPCEECPQDDPWFTRFQGT